VPGFIFKRQVVVLCVFFGFLKRKVEMVVTNFWLIEQENRCRFTGIAS